MPTINVLTENTANKIAAGEVIERPSSVVKELVENSIDADAAKIAVELRAGGKRFIRVADDGCGMSYDDALLCLERHATSKITEASDLDSIRTLGFRGEALPSIAAVSKTEIITRLHDGIAGTRVLVEGGVIRDVSEKGAPAGTQVTVRQLFYNTPARLKFMKSTATELGHVTAMLQRQALAHPHINFRLTSNDRETLNLTPAASIIDRLAVIWGNAFTRDLREGACEADGIAVSGYFGTPALTRANRNYQFFFLNRRPITNRLLGTALADAYRGRVMSDRFPVAFVFIEIDPRLVDVNIHPTKREVRFADPNRIFDAMRKAFAAAFNAVTHTHHIPAAPVAPTTEPTRAPADERPLFQSIKIDEDSLASVLPQLDESSRPQPGAPLPLARPTADFSSVPANLRFVKQVFNSYLLCVDDNDLIIIDQHALHERMVYDALVARSERTDPTTQQMLIPATIELSADKAEVLADNLDLFARIGIEIQPFGTRTFAVTALASVHSEVHIADIVREAVDELCLSLRMKAPREILHRLMTISACKNSIKAGDPLGDSEVEVLLEGLKNLPGPPTCLHGRPLVLRLNQAQIARAFGRKG
jgi:DNA mismatch repair protein MutL